VPGATLEVVVRGTGEPVVLMPTALTTGELRPLAEQLADAGFGTVRYHRRGYAGSSGVEGPGDIRRDAQDCRRLIEELGLARVHLVGVSYSAAVALELAAGAPGLVHSLCVIEPPPTQVPHAEEFLDACRELVAAHRRDGAESALEQFMGRLVGPDWRAQVERDLPGGVAEMQRDAETFFATDVPALLGWRFDRAAAARITQPVLYLGGSDSGPWFAEVRELVLDWLPQAEDAVLAGADHSLALTHADQLAEVLVPFLRRHRIAPGG
jgi:pimeloyl-ACP methyl ester carboxylesterase